MDNALFQKIDKSVTKALEQTNSSGLKGRTPPPKVVIVENICAKYGMTEDDFFAACMERAVV